MTDQSRKRGNTLASLIEEAKDNIDRWERAYAYIGKAEMNCLFTDSNRYEIVRCIHVPFDVLKALSLDGFRKELKKLEDEFNAL
jgi:hypothetical protein